VSMPRDISVTAEARRGFLTMASLMEVGTAVVALIVVGSALVPVVTLQRAIEAIWDD